MINIKNWRNLQNSITTDSLWISSTSTKNRPLFVIPKRDWPFRNDNNFHGIFIPEIPFQFITRFTKSQDDIIWDPFYGSGTTKRIADWLGFKGVYSDLTPIDDFAKRMDISQYQNEEITPIAAQVAFCHPPYHNIVKYSESPNDGSNKSSINAFLNWIEIDVVPSYKKHIKPDGYCILVIGNLYEKGEEHTLGVWTKDKFCENGFKCKAHIIKDYGETKGTGGKNYNLNYVRQLRGGYNNFYGDNIFILQKKG